MIYLDHAATTRPEPEVLEAMTATAYGNASSTHAAGYAARSAINQAKLTIAGAADLLGPGIADTEIFFTGGGTETNNYCIKAPALAIRMDCQSRVSHDFGDMHLVTTAIEHPSVLESMRFLEKLGAEVTYVQPETDGRVTSEKVLAAIRPNTVLVSCMAANNETGVLQPIQAIGQGLSGLDYNCFGRKILFHVDGVQMFGQLPMRLKDWKVDLMSASGHKIYGPQGIGLLYQRESLKMPPLLHGGGQELGVRSGTEAVPLIAGFRKAVEMAAEDLGRRSATEVRLRDLLYDLLKAELGSAVTWNGVTAEKLPGHLNISVNTAVGGDLLAAELDLAGICVSTGSACAAGKQEPSYVLTAMGVDRSLSDRSLRFSIGRENTEEDIRTAARETIRIIRKHL